MDKSNKPVRATKSLARSKAITVLPVLAAIALPGLAYSHAQTYGRMYGMTEVSPNDVWAVGQTDTDQAPAGCEIEHWDGKSWSMSEYPQHNYSIAASASATNDVWVAGQDTQSGQPGTEHWDGKTWTSIPADPVGNGTFTGIKDFGPNDVWATGYFTASNGYYQAFTQHWNGKKWSNVAIPEPGDDPLDHNYVLLGVSGVASNDLWTVGVSIPGNDGGRTLTEHWDGKAWSVVKSPSLKYSSLQAVAALSSKDVEAVGFSEKNGSGTDGVIPLNLHWDGTSWSRVDVPRKHTGINVAVTAGSTEIVGAGNFYKKKNELDGRDYVFDEIWDGNQWSAFPEPHIAASYVTAGTASSPNDIWLTGSYTSEKGQGSAFYLFEHWDGTKWTQYKAKI